MKYDYLHTSGVFRFIHCRCHCIDVHFSFNNSERNFLLYQNDIIREFLFFHIIATSEKMMTRLQDVIFLVRRCSRRWIVIAREMWHKTIAQKKIDLIFVFQVSWKCDNKKKIGCDGECAANPNCNCIRCLFTSTWMIIIKGLKSFMCLFFNKCESTIVSWTKPNLCAGYMLDSTNNRPVSWMKFKH